MVDLDNAPGWPVPATFSPARDPSLSTVPVWGHTQMRQALAERDIARTYRLLQRYGVSQRRIASATAQSQSEISEILAGRRVVSYDVLLRIAEGLHIPRGHMGLAYDDTTAALINPTTSAHNPDTAPANGPPLWWVYDTLVTG